MDSSSTDALLKLFDEVIEWKKKKKRRKTDSLKFNWTLFHLSVVRNYVSESGFSSNLKLLRSAKLYKNVIDAKTVASFAQELQELFVVPKLHQLLKNELISAFIDFLLQLLCRRTGSINSIKDQIHTLEKELKFLLTVLGDTWLVDAEHEQIQNLLSEVEAVADEAGTLVHSIIFSTFADRVFRTIDQSLGVLLQNMELLKGNIVKFSNELPLISNAGMTAKTGSVDSLFIVDSLLHDLENLLDQDDSLSGDVKDQIKILRHELMFSQSLLKDMKVPPYSEIGELKEPLVRIRDVAYEVEYLINSFLLRDVPLFYLSIRLSNVIQKIKLIGSTLQEIKDNYGAQRVAENFSSQLSLQAKRNSDVVDIVVGFEDKIIEILDQLVGGSEQLQIISIFGMPGLGKTTLAKKLYDHPSTNEWFDKRAWCIVSQTYQRKSLLIDILISSRSGLDDVRIMNMEEESLLQHIYQSLKGRRYLIVMDDIWSLNAWNELRRCFPNDGNGSRILFTTRHKDVAPSSSTIYALPSLSNDQCWELLEKKVFDNKPCPSQLLEIGKKVAANCYGLPLVVVVIAGILATINKEESTWKNVAGRLTSYISCGGNNSLMQILELSYKHLPDHLKPCFLYFGAFPEDKKIPIRKLMRLWIAEGFISKEEKRMAEIVAEEYLMELVDKSLVIVSKRRSNGGAKSCVVHDLLRDMCIKIAEEENFLKLMNNNYSIDKKNQRLCAHVYQARPQNFRPLSLHVRSFIGSHVDSTLDVINMKLLRVLDLPNTKGSLGELDGLELLVHLRYLAIKYMPASIGSLMNLEFLVVNSSKVVVITAVILKMMKLRYLHLAPQAVFDIGCKISQTNNLEFLSDVIVRELKDVEILKCSPHLRKLKCHCFPLKGENGAYRYPDLSFLTQLGSLKITTFHGHEMAEISFPSNIKKLSLYGLRLHWEKMSIIGGLPKLEVLKLRRDAFVGGIWETIDDEFQQLRYLKLERLDLTQWNVSSSEHFPKLQQLVLHNCYNLKEVPCEIGEIVTLQSIEVERCRKTVAESARKIQEEQLDMGNEELRVIIRHVPR